MRGARSLSSIAVAVIVAGSVSPVFAATHTVTQTGLTFVPANVDVVPGDKIEWIWTNGTHTVTSGTPCTPDGRFNDPLDAGNQTVAFFVPNDEPAGVIDYFCIPHCLSAMTGTITVQEPIPAVSQWGLLVMALLGLAVGTIMFRRARRRTVAA